jgi:hypothetical protein
MAGEVRRFAGQVQAALGPAAPGIAELLAAADALDAGAQTAAEWQQKVVAWTTARDRLGDLVVTYLLDGIPELPGLRDLADDVGWDDPEGLRGSVEIGPLKLEFSSTSLVIEPPAGIGGQPIVIGPLQPGSVGAAIKPPFGDGGLPGGGDVVRLPDDHGFGGRLQMPLGPVSIDAAALLARLADGTPSFLAVLGATFTPPIQLSFGFSLDRVGGIVGVNRRMDTDALTLAVRTGAGGNALFATQPPASAAALASDLDRFFPPVAGTHVVGPTLRLSWLSMGSDSFVSLDLGVVLELPSARVAVLGVARAAIPSLPAVIQLRIDVLGIIDPGAQLVSVDGSLVDSSLLGIFTIYGDAAMRVSWGSQAYTVLSVGGFYPGFNPEPARLPALRRVGMSTSLGGVIEVRVEGYVAVTSNTIQLGGRYEVSISLGLEAHGFLQVDALVQFRPFHFEAACSAGFDVSAGGFSFGGVRLEGRISGPGPIVIRGRLTIETFLFDISWDESFTLGSGPADAVPRLSLLDVFGQELAKVANLHAEHDQDPVVVLRPRPGQTNAAGTAKLAAVPPTGSLRWSQRRAPMGLPIDRADGQPLSAKQGVTMTGTPVTDTFSPGSFCNLTDAEALNRPPFDRLQAGVVLSPAAAPPASSTEDLREVDLIVIRNRLAHAAVPATAFDLASLSALVGAAARPPAITPSAPLVVAHAQHWTVPSTGIEYDSATHAHQAGSFAGDALASEDALAHVDLAGV